MQFPPDTMSNLKGMNINCDFPVNTWLLSCHVITSAVALKKKVFNLINDDLKVQALFRSLK